MHMQQLLASVEELASAARFAPAELKKEQGLADELVQLLQIYTQNAERDTNTSLSTWLKVRGIYTQSGQIRILIFVCPFLKDQHFEILLKYTVPSSAVQRPSWQMTPVFRQLRSGECRP